MNKPPYRVPLLAEIRKQKPNGLVVASTFSGCGGSCLGFRMAGYTVKFASEFIDAARETYAANFPEVPIDAGDVRQLTGSQIRDVVGGDVDVLEGSPPCASFSMAGNREADWGKVKEYSGKQQRVDDLFDEYIRLVGELQPRAFVAENVKGLVIGKAKGQYLRILKSFRDAGYRVGAKILDAQWLGVPQRRQRVIFVGFRNDLDLEPAFPSPLPYRYTIRDAIGDVDALAHVYGYSQGQVHGGGDPAPTVMAHGMAGNKMTAIEIIERGRYDERDAGAPDGIGGYAIGDEWDRTPQGGQSDRYFNLIRPTEDEPTPSITAAGGGAGTASVVHPTERRKFTIPELRRLCGFPDDFVLTGSYPQQWERLGRAVPPPMMAAVARTIYGALDSLG